MEILIPRHRPDPNEKVYSVYSGVAPGGRTVTTVVKPSVDRNRLEAHRVYGPGLARGQGGRVAILVLGGMETTLAEMQYILEAKRNKKFVPKRTGGEIVDMCRLLAQRRNEQIEAMRRHIKANPSEAPKFKRKQVRLYLPVGFRYVPTSEPGLKVLARA